LIKRHYVRLPKKPGTGFYSTHSAPELQQNLRKIYTKDARPAEKSVSVSILHFFPLSGRTRLVNALFLAYNRLHKVSETGKIRDGRCETACADSSSPCRLNRGMKVP